MQLIPITHDLLHGALELEQTAAGLLPHRLPAWARAQCDDPQLAMVEAQPSGVRLAFRTEARTVELEALPTRRSYVGAPPRPSGVFDLVVDGIVMAQASIDGGNMLTIDMATGTTSLAVGQPGSVRFADLPAHDKIVEIWLPHNEQTELVALRADTTVAPIADDARRIWLHHGSSISHGSDADSPTGTWPAVAARLAGVRLVNLGVGGSALLDPFVARTMRDTPADVISLKIGINIVNTDLMRRRAFGPAVHGFLDTIRDGHPTTPLLVVSPILCPIHEDVPGPTVFDFAELVQGRLAFRATGEAGSASEGRLTLRTIRDELRRIVEQRSATDQHLRYIDGLALYGEQDARDLPLPDGLHPDGRTHRLIGERFVDAAGCWSS